MECGNPSKYVYSYLSSFINIEFFFRNWVYPSGLAETSTVLIVHL